RPTGGTPQSTSRAWTEDRERRRVPPPTPHRRSHAPDPATSSRAAGGGALSPAGGGAPSAARGAACGAGGARAVVPSPCAVCIMRGSPRQAAARRSVHAALHPHGLLRARDRGELLLLPDLRLVFPPAAARARARGHGADDRARDGDERPRGPGECARRGRAPRPLRAAHL